MERLFSEQDHASRPPAYSPHCCESLSELPGFFLQIILMCLVCVLNFNYLSSVQEISSRRPFFVQCIEEFQFVVFFLLSRELKKTQGEYFFL